MAAVRKSEARSAARMASKSARTAETVDADVSSSDKVVDHVTTSIRAGRYVPGQRLVEADITRTLNVSRGPVREGFRRLDALGILTRTMHRGACVRTLSRTEAVDLLRAVEPLNGLIARLAAERFAKGDGCSELESFKRELRPYRERQENVSDLSGQRRHFYELLVAIGGNTQLPSVFPMMRIQLLRLQTHSFLGIETRHEHVESYARVTEAVIQGNGKLAEKALVSHVRRVQQAIASLPDAAFPPTDME